MIDPNAEYKSKKRVMGEELDNLRRMAFKGQAEDERIKIEGPIPSTIKDDIINSIINDYNNGLHGIIRHSHRVLSTAGDDPDVSPDTLLNLLRIFIDLYDEDPGNFPKGSWRMLLGRILSNNNIPIDLIKELVSKKGPDSLFFPIYVLQGLSRDSAHRGIKPPAAIRKDLDDEIFIPIYERVFNRHAGGSHMANEYDRELFSIISQYPDAKVWDVMISDAGTLKRKRYLESVRDKARQKIDNINESLIRLFVKSVI